MPFQFIKQLLPLPSFFTLSMPSEEEPNVFLATVGPYEAPCPVCKGKTVRHAQTLRRFRHGYAWHIGLIWIELPVPRHRCVGCDLTFTHDFGLELIQSSSALFRRELVRRCQGRSLADVSREYGLPYTTVERWFYTYASEQIKEENATRICVDDFALRKGQTYATSVLNADTGHVLATGPGRNTEAIQAVLKKVHGVIKEAMNFFQYRHGESHSSCFSSSASHHGPLSPRPIFHRGYAQKTALFK